MPTKEERIANIEAIELAQLAKATDRLTEAAANGLISEHDRDEQIARREQAFANRMAWTKGEKRPKQRKSQPLDDPEAFQPPK